MAIVVIELILHSAGTCQQRRYPWSARNGLRPPGIALTCKFPPARSTRLRPPREHSASISRESRPQNVLGECCETTLVPGAARRFPLLFNARRVGASTSYRNLVFPSCDARTTPLHSTCGCSAIIVPFLSIRSVCSLAICVIPSRRDRGLTGNTTSFVDMSNANVNRYFFRVVR